MPCPPSGLPVTVVVVRAASRPAPQQALLDTLRQPKHAVLGLEGVVQPSESPELPASVQQEQQNCVREPSYHICSALNAKNF